MRIIFMGTPEFAVHSLRILVEADYDIVAVITSADKYGGRGRKTLIESDVKKYAASQNLKIMQPTNLKNQVFLEELKALKADLQIIVAFRMLPEVVWNMPKFGSYNLHGSLLPKYRGAAPINWAIINGDTTTGVTSFKLKHEIDTGSVFLQREIPIYPSDNAGDLHDRMKYVAADVVLETVKAIEEGKAFLLPQKEDLVSHAPKLNKENTIIDFNNSPESVLNFIRGLSPYPTAWMPLGDKMLKIYKAAAISESQHHKPGDIISDNKNYIHVFCKEGIISIEELQLTGKKRMTTKEFLNGFDMENYSVKTFG